MMLHRHFESEKNKNITKLADASDKEKDVRETPDEAPKRRGRPRKNT